MTREADKERCRCAESVEVGSGWSLHGLWPLEGLVLRKQGSWEEYYEGVEIMGFTTSGYQLLADFLPHPCSHPHPAALENCRAGHFKTLHVVNCCWA